MIIRTRNVSYAVSEEQTLPEKKVITDTTIRDLKDRGKLADVKEKEHINK